MKRQPIGTRGARAEALAPHARSRTAVRYFLSSVVCARLAALLIAWSTEICPATAALSCSPTTLIISSALGPSASGAASVRIFWTVW